MKIILGMFFLGVTIISYAQEKNAKTFRDKFNASLVLSTDLSYEFQTSDIQKFEIILKPEFNYKFNRTSKLVLKSQVYSELRDYLEIGQPKENTVSNFSKRLFIDNKTNLELREFYFYKRFDNKLSLTIGKQQIVWGETDGLKLLDIVNPQNFREFFLDDFEDSRIPLWSVKTEFNINNLGVQLIWIPDNTYHITQDFNAPYFTRSLFKIPPSGISIQFNQARRPNKFIKDSDFGAKFSIFKNGWDLSLNYLYYYEDLPVFYSSLGVLNSQTTLIINPKYKRQQLIGGTFNKVFGSSTFRGELVYIFNQNFISNNPIASFNIEQSHLYKSVLGLDYIKGEYILSAQIFNEWITHNITPYNRDRLETNGTFLISKEMFNDSLKAEILWVHNINNNDGYLTPSIGYWLNTNTQLLLNANLFYGKNKFLFGQYTSRNRMSVGFKWGI